MKLEKTIHKNKCTIDWSPNYKSFFIKANKFATKKTNSRKNGKQILKLDPRDIILLYQM